MFCSQPRRPVTMAEHANRDYYKPESRQIEDNFVKLKEMFVNKSQALELVEQQKIKLEENSNALTNANKMLKESNGKLLEINNKQQIMLCSLEKSFKTMNLLKIELDKLKKENLKLKSSLSNNSVSNIQKPPADAIENYNSLLQKKIVNLEKQLLKTQTMAKQKSSLHCPMHEKEISKLKTKNNALCSENKSLREHLTNFRSFHNQIVTEMRLKNLKNATDRNQRARNNPIRISPTIIDLLDSSSDEIQPVQVNIIDSDAD